MREFRSLPSLLLIAALILTGSGPAIAESPKGGADAAMAQSLRKAQGMVRQLSQEKADLEAKLEEQAKVLEAKTAETTALQTQLQQAQANLQALQKNVAVLEAEKKKLTAEKTTLLNERAALQHEVAEQHSKLQALAELQQQTAMELERFQRDNLMLVGAVKERESFMRDCTIKNQGLLKANRDLLDQFSQEGLWDKVKLAEPFTGIGRVGRENAVQDYKYRLEDLEVTPWQEPSAAAAEPPQAALPESPPSPP